MVDSEIEQKLTKVTTPIVYRDWKDITIKRLMEEKKITEEEKAEAEEKFSQPCYRACTIGFLGNSLVRHCAQKIFLIDLSNKLDDEILSGVPKYLQNRIVWADANRKIEKEIEYILKPINDELGYIGEKKRNELRFDDIDQLGHEHGYCILYEFLRTMAVAVKYNTEADLDLNLASLAVSRIKKQIHTGEAVSALARIEGIINCYRITDNIPTLSFVAETTPAELIGDLLDDVKIIELSQSRFMLGIPGSFQIAMIKIKQELQDILRDRKKRKFLQGVSKIGNIATKQVGVEIPEINSEYHRLFGPPLISLDECKPNCLLTPRYFSDIISEEQFFQQIAQKKNHPVK